MKIKYGDLPQRSLCDKLISVSFNSPHKNLAVFKFSMAVLPALSYIENERTKLFQKHGVPSKDNPDVYYIPQYKLESFQSDFKQILDMEVEEEIPDLPLCEDDFMDERCQYSNDKSKWLNALEIATILKLCKK